MRKVSEKIKTRDKEMIDMSVSEVLEYERVAYVEEMEEYLQNLKQMGKMKQKRYLTKI